MGLNELLARFAVRAAQVLVVEVPGHWDARMELEQQLLRRGWRPASTPADADVLAVCGVPGPELSELVDRLWEQMPGPRVRADITSPGGVGPALDDAAALLLDTPHHRTDARERPQEPEIPEDVDHGGHGGMDHGEMDHGEMDHGGHGGHGGMDHSGHGGMDMAPGGIALAGGGEDRDGLEMDVLHLPLGPVLPFWPAGLVLHCSLQGDVVVDAEASVVDGAGAGGPGPGPAPAAVVVWCDQVVALLALAGAEDAASGARRARDALLHGDRGAARAAAERLHRTIRRSRLLRWSLRGLLPLDPSALEHHGLPRHCLGDAHDRLLSRVERIRAEAGGAVPVPVEDGAVPWAVLPELVTGLELASVRLAVASLGLDPHPAVQEVGHG
ncbi:hypothetical protein M3E18_11790 [Kocuria sp. p3-SID1433]|uniref:hypothetical protein n=1 Tax=unclassified Kocuria TaxID=2649579 RepID=UPI0021A28406|nr:MULTISPECIES: hypothetical protein [unclassified Kocuria]MCT1601079.1 hypothetical protein [Kocuria sp. p3-SID1428]MCT2181201.1 hypothetical protein [Kocuria sp. p3-SID1433]